MVAPEPVRRTTEIEDFSNLYFVHVVAGYLVPRLARLGVSANAVSVAGMVFGVLAGLAYDHYGVTAWALAGFILMVAWHVMDGADGQLARLTNTQSRTGKVLDGICDYVTFISVYLGLALVLGREDGGWVWLLILVSGACHAVQSATYELQREDYNFWARGGLERLRQAPAAGGSRGSGFARVLALLQDFYERVQGVAAAGRAGFYLRLAAAVRRHPERAEGVQRRYAQVFAPAVRRWAVLSANYRTLGIFVCALLKGPIWYFWFEIFGLSLVLVVLLWRQKRRYAGFLRELDGWDERRLAAQ